MYGRRRFYRRPARKYLRKRKATGKRSSVSSRIKKYVKKELHRNVENKERSIYGTNNSIQVGDSYSGSIPLLLQTVSGTSEEQRIGNQLKVVKGQIKLCVNVLPYNATTNPNQLPCWVRVMVVRDLVNNGQQGTIPSSTWNNIFRAGSSAFTFGGNPLDICAETNKDIVRLLYNKVFKLGQSYPNTTLATPIGGWNDNSPMAKMLTINWGKWCKKQIKYSDGTAYPNNENLYLIIQACNSDGTACIGKNLIEWHYQSVMQFEDA